jgi:hypothetical protein
MRRLFYVFVAALAASLAGAFGATAGQQYSRPEASFLPVDHNNNTVCCTRGGQGWWSDSNRCYQAGGQPTANSYCRQGEQYDDGYSYGYNDPYNNPDRRVCCSSQYGVGWASWRQCRYARGQDVMNKVCRKTRYGIDYNRLFGGHNNGYYGQDPYNNTDRRVCCKRGYQDWWSTARECRRVGGYETANRECRND